MTPKNGILSAKHENDRTSEQNRRLLNDCYILDLSICDTSKN